MAKTIFSMILLIGLSSFAEEGPQGRTFKLNCQQSLESKGVVSLEAAFAPVQLTHDDVLGIINIAGVAKLKVNNWGLQKDVEIPVAGAILPGDELTGAEEFTEFHPVNATADDQALRHLIFHVSIRQGKADVSWVFNLKGSDFTETSLQCELSENQL